LILIFGSYEHFGLSVVVPSEAGPSLGAQMISVSELSDGDNNQPSFVNRFNLIGCNVKSGKDRCLAR
jgi:hypothetical protein